jgi:hypothetical protein
VAARDAHRCAFRECPTASPAWILGSSSCPRSRLRADGGALGSAGASHDLAAASTECDDFLSVKAGRKPGHLRRLKTGPLEGLGLTLAGGDEGKATVVARGRARRAKA